VFFEKKRIAEGKPKNAGRLKAEGGAELSGEIYEILGEEVECHEDAKGRLIITETGKPVKLY
jgi:hypothetical protein